jgi:hypothetical protein
MTDDAARPHFAEISTAFPTVPESVAAARRFVAVSLRRFEFSDTAIENAMIAASELVAHAFETGRPPLRIRVRSIEDGRAAIEVTHGGTADDAAAPAEADLRLTAAGRSMVDATAARWGSRVTGTGVLAWFEIEDLTIATPASPPSTGGTD